MTATEARNLGRLYQALKAAQASLCSHLCMEHEALPTSHHPGCQDARQVLRDLRELNCGLPLAPGEFYVDRYPEVLDGLPAEHRLDLEAMLRAPETLPTADEVYGILSGHEADRSGFCIFCGSPMAEWVEQCPATTETLWRRIGEFTDRANGFREEQGKNTPGKPVFDRCRAVASVLEATVLKLRRRHEELAATGAEVPDGD
jgi:hypothetical protein